MEDKKILEGSNLIKELENLIGQFFYFTVNLVCFNAELKRSKPLLDGKSFTTSVASFYIEENKKYAYTRWRKDFITIREVE